jgi:hypothetical protein
MKVSPMATTHAPPRGAGDPAGEAIATVLRAEAQARASIVQAQADAAQAAEAARASARSLADRTDRRIRRVVSAFERERAARVAAIDAEAAAIARPHALTGEERSALESAVRAIARDLTGGPP